MADETKIVINIRDDRATIGVSKPNCDPVFKTVEGNLATIIATAEELVTEAREKWAETPRNPKCESPLPSQETAPARTAPSRPAQTTTPTNQRALF